jgi:5-formyltetrahydrofolate cyclo-ligase
MKAEKDQLRQQMREEAKRHSAEERAAGSRRICELIRAQEVWQRAKATLLFVPTAHEPDISPLMKDGKGVSLPSFNEKLGRYEARLVKGEQDLVPGKFGIAEPKTTCPPTDLSTLDLVLAPGVAFATDGSRLGRGKGYYDRLLEQVKAIKIGVCFDWQVLSRIPCDGHDISMDYVVTSNRWLRA